MPSRHTDSPAQIAARLRLIRLAYGDVQGYEREISQSEFARRCGIGVSNWNNAESGYNRIGVDTALAVCRRTGITLDYIYRGIEANLPRALAVAVERLQKNQRP